MRFLLGVLLAGVAGLAGGQVWVLTDSLLLSWTAGLATLLGLWAICRAVGRRTGLGRDRAVFGEVRNGVYEQAFTERVDVGGEPRQRLQKKVQTRPERVAGSVRALLAKSRQAGDEHSRQDG